MTWQVIIADIIELSLIAMLRISEACNLRKKDIIFHKRRVGDNLLEAVTIVLICPKTATTVQRFQRLEFLANGGPFCPVKLLKRILARTKSNQVFFV